MTDPRERNPVDARFKMIWGGEWRLVTYMRDQAGNETNDRFRATAAVLYIDPDNWVATNVSPGEIIKRDDVSASGRQWDTVV